MARATFLLKTEPSVYSYDRLEKEKRACWDGVANPVAQKNIRSAKPGDRLVVYHTGDEKQAVGLAEVVSVPYVDPKNPKLWVFDLEARGKLNAPVSLAVLKAHPAFQDSPLVKIGRLSVVPLSPEQLLALLTLGKTKTKS